MIREFDENKNKLNLQVEFASNPRQLYFSDKNDVFLCDVRGRDLRERFIPFTTKTFLFDTIKIKIDLLG